MYLLALYICSTKVSGFNCLRFMVFVLASKFVERATVLRCGRITLEQVPYFLFLIQVP